MSLTAGKHIKGYSYMRKGKRVVVKGYSRKTRARRHSRVGGAAAPAADYFQDYAQVGGAYDNYGAYGVDPRVAGAYDMYYDAARQAGAYDYGQTYADPRMAGAQQIQESPYDWASQARYAGADAYAALPLTAGDFGLTAGKRGRDSYMRSKPGKTKKTVYVKATKHVKGQRKGKSKTSKLHSRVGGSVEAKVAGRRRRRSRSRSRVGGAVEAKVAGRRTRSRSHSRKHRARAGGVPKAVAQPVMDMWSPAQVGGYADVYAPAYVGGAADYLGYPATAGFDMGAPALTAGKRVATYKRHKPGKSTMITVKGFNRKSHNKKKTGSRRSRQ